MGHLNKVAPIKTHVPSAQVATRPFLRRRLQLFMKLKTIDDLCGAPAGTFQKFIAQQHEDARLNEIERKERIKKARYRK